LVKKVQSRSGFNSDRRPGSSQPANYKPHAP
jgi:hypothetical protein